MRGDRVIVTLIITYKFLNGLHSRVGGFVIVRVTLIEAVVTDCPLHILSYFITLWLVGSFI